MKEIRGLVYKATSPSGKVYIGITITPLKERIRLHLREVDRGSHRPFHNAIRKYGLDNIHWEIIDTATSWRELCELEKKYIAEHNSKSNGYNMTLGGEGTHGVIHSREWRIADSNRRKAYFSDPDHRRKQSIANKMAHAENPDQARQHSHFMKKRFTETQEKEKVADGMRRFLSDPDNLATHSIQRGAKPFIVYKDGEVVGEWLTQWQCARDLDLDVGHISACLHGSRRAHKGYTFRYK